MLQPPKAGGTVARDEKLDLLQSIPLFAGFDRHHLERLGMLTEEVDVGAGNVLIRQGEHGDDLMVIVSGGVGVERNGERISHLGPGEFRRDRAHRTRTAHRHRLRRGATRLLVVNHRDFHALMEEFPEVAVQVLATLAHRLRGLESTAVN